jgi:hypothetical protein
MELLAVSRLPEGPEWTYEVNSLIAAFGGKIMSNNIPEIATEAPRTSNPLDAIPDETPFDVP